ncbi:hypothetical protein P4H39_04290 [Paenibacillus lautus]|uniref:hypothetical protein n=1 Tax=Paenibacillus lautus TaxID=1401 RepID=UPI002DB74912|nr:hypothetical protein [Paenibacillus lautus]MEC0201843.1 hypothetical protein [Paenibacillus lautus]
MQPFVECSRILWGSGLGSAPSDSNATPPKQQRFRNSRWKKKALRHDPIGQRTSLYVYRAEGLHRTWMNQING